MVDSKPLPDLPPYPLGFSVVEVVDLQMVEQERLLEVFLIQQMVFRYVGMLEGVIESFLYLLFHCFSVHFMGVGRVLHLILHGLHGDRSKVVGVSLVCYD